MALRPEPLAELLPQAETIVVAEVVALWDSTANAWRTELDLDDVPERAAIGNIPRPVGAAPPIAGQRLKLRVMQVLRGVERPEIEVDKPQGCYLLVPGHRGPFLLAAGKPRPLILGRYGPDTHSLADIAEALANVADNMPRQR